MTSQLCPICGDTFRPDPNHVSANDCPACQAWASRPMFRLSALRGVWVTSKRLLHHSCMVKRAALRAPACGVSWDPVATVRVAQVGS